METTSQTTATTSTTPIPVAPAPEPAAAASPSPATVPAPSEVVGKPTVGLDAKAFDYPALFEEGPSEDALRGIAPEPVKGQPAPAAAATPEPAKPGEQPPATTAPSGEGVKKEGEVQAKADPEGAKPPEGFVPLPALHEERAKRKAAADEAAYWRQQAENLRQAQTMRPADAPAQPREIQVPEHIKEDLARVPQEYVKFFTEDSKDGLELREALEQEGPRAASILARSISVERAIAEERRRSADRDRDQAMQASNQYIGKCVDAMQEAVPGIYDEQSPIREALTSVALEKAGFAPDDLKALTSPKTMFIGPDGNPYYLGKAAVSVVKLAKLAHESGDATAMKAREDAAFQRGKEEAAKEFAAKFKSTTASGFVALGDMPAATEQPGARTDFSEKALLKLNDADFDRMLRGEGLPA